MNFASQPLPDRRGGGPQSPGERCYSSMDLGFQTSKMRNERPASAGFFSRQTSPYQDVQPQARLPNVQISSAPSLPARNVTAYAPLSGPPWRVLFGLVTRLPCFGGAKFSTLHGNNPERTLHLQPYRTVPSGFDKPDCPAVWRGSFYCLYALLRNPFIAPPPFD